jgi:hypothetical protein
VCGKGHTPPHPLLAHHLSGTSTYLFSYLVCSKVLWVWGEKWLKHFMHIWIKEKKVLWVFNRSFTKWAWLINHWWLTTFSSSPLPEGWWEGEVENVPNPLSMPSSLLWPVPILKLPRGYQPPVIWLACEQNTVALQDIRSCVPGRKTKYIFHIVTSVCSCPSCSPQQARVGLQSSILSKPGLCTSLSLKC